MSEYTQTRRAAARSVTQEAAPAGHNRVAQSLNQSPRVQSLMQMKHVLDESPRVRSHDLLQRALNGAAVQREAMPDEEKLMQAKREPAQMQGESDGLREAEEETLQGKFNPAQREPALDDEEALQGEFEPVQRRENHTGLPDQLKAGVESLSGLSLDDVRVHYNSAEPATLQAAAYAQGSDIHVAPGQERHLPHEAWHVVQQKHGRVRPTLQTKGVPINDDGHLEREADAMGAQALRMQDADHAQPHANEGEPVTIRGDVHQRVAGSAVVQRVYLMNADGTIRWIAQTMPPTAYGYVREHDDGVHGPASLWARHYDLDVTTFHDRDAFLEQRQTRGPPYVADQEK